MMDRIIEILRGLGATPEQVQEVEDLLDTVHHDRYHEGYDDGYEDGYYEGEVAE